MTEEEIEAVQGEIRSKRDKLRIVIDSILALCLVVILALVIYGAMSNQPSRQDIIDKLDNLQRQVTILNCQINVETEAERFACESLNGIPEPPQS